MRRLLPLAVFLIALLPAPIWAQTNATMWCWNGAVSQPCNSGNPLYMSVSPASTSVAGITAVVSASAEATHVLKATPGNLYSVYATNTTSTAGFLVTLNATSAPVDGAITPLDCVEMPGNTTVSINYRSGPPEVFSTGIVAVLTSANTCFTKTTGTITGFIHGDVQ